MVNDQVKSELRSLVEEILKDMEAKKQAKADEVMARRLPRTLPAESSETQESLALEPTLIPRYNCFIDPSQPDKIVNFRLNQDLFDAMHLESEREQISIASFIRKSLMHRTSKAPLDKTHEIDKLIQDCLDFKDGTRTFTFEGEQGFLTQASNRKLTGEIWTPENLDKIAPYLRNTAYTDECVLALGLDRTQIQYLKVSLMASIDESQQENEYLFMPFGICLKCHKPLTKKDMFEASACPHCGNGQGRIIPYDMANQEAFYKSYAVCSQCFKPLTEHQHHKWKACPYCGNTEPDIPIIYEGIKTEPIPRAKPKAKLKEETNPETIKGKPEKETKKEEPEQEKLDKEEPETQEKPKQTEAPEKLVKILKKEEVVKEKQ